MGEIEWEKSVNDSGFTSCIASLRDKLHKNLLRLKERMPGNHAIFLRGNSKTELDLFVSGAV